MIARLWHLIVKEFIQFRRDRVLSVFLFTFPVLQLVLVAQTAGGDVINLPLAVLDLDNSPASRSVVRAMDNTEELRLAYFPANMAEVTGLLDRGQAAVAVIIPPGLATDLARSGPLPAIQVLVDGSNVSSGSTALSMAEGAITSTLARQLITSTGLASAMSSQAVELQTTIRFNPAMNGKYIAIPGLFAFVVYQVAMVVASVGLVRERELGTLEQLVVTPVRRGELLSGKAVPAIVVGMINFTLLFLVVVGVFRIPMRGSWSLLFGLSGLFIATEVGVGMMISSVSRSQQQAVLMVFPLSMIDLSLSGYLVPVESMPRVLQALSLFSPLRHYMTILKSIMLKGADLSILWPDAVALVLLAAAVGLLALRNIGRSFE